MVPVSRPVAEPQSALRCPLNYVLRGETNVRVLRCFVLEEFPLTRPQLARLASISNRGVIKALEDLVEAGVVEPLGSGHGTRFHLRENHPLLPELTQLFRAERDRSKAIWARLSELVGDLEVRPDSAWVQGPVARKQDELNAPITLALLARSTDLARIKAELNEKLGELERKLDVMIDVVGRAKADLPADKDVLEEVVLIFGPHPTALIARPSKKTRARRTHADADAQLRRLGEQLAALVREDPTLVPKAAKRVREMMDEEGAAPDLREWLRILENNSNPQIGKLLESDSERAVRLRQSPVLLSVLTPEQRARVESSPRRRRAKKK